VSEGWGQCPALKSAIHFDQALLKAPQGQLCRSPNKLSNPPAGMRGSRLAPRLLQLVANASGNTPSSSAGTQKWAAARLSAAAGAGAGGGSQAAAAPGSRRQWALALAACLGAGAAGAQLISSGSGSSTAECKAAQDPEAAGAAPKRKTRVVVLGTGWGAVSFLKNLDPKSFGGACPAAGLAAASSARRLTLPDGPWPLPHHTSTQPHPAAQAALLPVTHTAARPKPPNCMCIPACR
jgi:hypothetical protein